MAEVLATFSGAAGFVSLVLQLGDCAVRMRQLYRNYQNIPRSIEYIVQDVETFSRVLQANSKDFEQQQARGSVSVPQELLNSCVSLCKQSIKNVENAITKLEKTIQKHRLLGKLLAIADNSEITELCRCLESAKSSLRVAYHFFIESRRQNDHNTICEVLEQIMTIVGSHSSALQSQDKALSLLAQSLALQSPGHSRPPQIATIANRTSSFRDIEYSMSAGQFEHHVNRKNLKNWPHNKYFTFIIRPWLITRIWQISLQSSYTGWQALFHTYHLVPNDAPILAACYAGEYTRARGLIESGYASPLDRSSNRSFNNICTQDDELFALTPFYSPFFGALQSQNWDLCSYLISIAEDELTSQLQDYIAGRSFEESLRDLPCSLYVPYTLLLDRVADLDFLMIPEHCDYDCREKHPTKPLWFHTRDSELLRLVQNALPVPYKTLSLQVRFENAIRFGLRMPYSSPELFRQIACTDFSDPQLAASRYYEGSSALHYIAKVITEKQGCGEMAQKQLLEMWKECAIQLIQAGVDLYAQNQNGATPLETLLYHCWRPQIAKLLRAFLEYLLLAGVDLHDYGRNCVKLVNHDLRLSLGSGLVRTEKGDWLMFGPQPSDWDIWTCQQDTIRLFHLRKKSAIPGAWPEPDLHTLPLLFIALDGQSWQSSTSRFMESPRWEKKIASLPFLASDVAQSQTYSSLSGSARIINDDSGVFIRFLSSSRAMSDSTRRRSRSSPPDKRTSSNWEIEEYQSKGYSSLMMRGRIGVSRNDVRRIYGRSGCPSIMERKEHSIRFINSPLGWQSAEYDEEYRRNFCDYVSRKIWSCYETRRKKEGAIFLALKSNNMARLGD